MGPWPIARWYGLSSPDWLDLCQLILTNYYFVTVTIATLLCPELSAPAVVAPTSKALDALVPRTDPSLLVSYPGIDVEPPLPEDDVPDTELGLDRANRRADERYPTQSLVTPKEDTVRSVFTQAAQRRFRRELDAVDPRITAKLDQPFGKENLLQSFVSEAALRHVLLPLWKSGFLAGDVYTWDSLCLAYYPASLLRDLLSDYGDVPFSSARGFNPDWSTETDINQDRVAATTAAFLHFNGSVADLVRWIGGPHVAEQRDHHTTMKRLHQAGVDERVCSDLRRIFYDGIPALCQAEATEDNFRAYYRYGNHSTVDEEPEKTYKAMVKDSRKGFTLLLDQRATLLMLHCHLTPQGVVDLNTPYKSPRPIFDSSFRPEPWCWAINDWTSPDNEPPLTFSTAEMEFMVWLYNLRITYPSDEIYLADDDISGAFRLMKYHPNLVSMHSSRQCGYCVVNTGGTFGDNTNPSNFDPLGLGRRQLAHFLWTAALDAVAVIKPYLPALNLAPAPTPDDVAGFRPADRDSTNPGALFEDGSRKPPPYNMHVDDALYADIGSYILHTICVSILALFWLLGFPTNPLVPSPLSVDKFESFYNHQRKMVGRRFNSRTLSVGLLDYKLDQLHTLLQVWVAKSSFDLLEIANLLGILENHTRYARWARCWYFSLQNAVRTILHGRFKIISRIFDRSGRAAALRRQLPATLMNRLHTILARDKAQLLWATKQRYGVTPEILASLQHLLAYTANTTDPWDVPLGLIIPRDHHLSSRGDASFAGGGAYCSTFRFWFDIAWSRRTIKGATRTKPSSDEYVHINALEFIVVIIQLAAVITRLEDCASGRSDPSVYFLADVPDIPVWLVETDNMVSVAWERKATSASLQGQGLVSVYAELLRRRHVQTRCEHLAGSLNVVADDISRNDFSLPFSARVDKLYKVHPILGTLDFFQPSQELLQLLTLRLFSRLNPVPCILPAQLGRFQLVDSTTSISVVL